MNSKHYNAGIGTMRLRFIAHDGPPFAHLRADRVLLSVSEQLDRLLGLSVPLIRPYKDDLPPISDLINLRAIIQELGLQALEYL